MKQQSSQAKTAKEIRKVLKKEFPGVKFSVTSRSFSNGDSVDVDWTNGPTYDTVFKLIKRFESGSFDSSTDSYEYKTIVDWPTAKYVHANRDFTDDVYEKSFEETKNYFGDLDGVKTLDEYIETSYSRYDSARNLLYRYLVKMDLVSTEINLESFRKLLNHV